MILAVLSAFFFLFFSVLECRGDGESEVRGGGGGRRGICGMERESSLLCGTAALKLSWGLRHMKTRNSCGRWKNENSSRHPELSFLLQQPFGELVGRSGGKPGTISAHFVSTGAEL